MDSKTRLHCRINGTLADYCRFNSSIIVFGLPIGYTIYANNHYIISISTRGRDLSISNYEGLSLLNAAIYSMKI